MAFTYRNGGGVDQFGQEIPQSEAKARELFAIAAEKGSPQGLWEHGQVLHAEGSVEMAHEAWIRAAAGGWLEAQVTMGLVRRKEKDHRAAAGLFRAAASNGSAMGQWYVGRMLKYGQGIDRDEEEGFHYIQQAAQQDLPGALFSLALCYLEGRAPLMLGCQDRHGHGPTEELILQLYLRSASYGYVKVLPLSPPLVCCGVPMPRWSEPSHTHAMVTLFSSFFLSPRPWRTSPRCTRTATGWYKT